MKTKVIIKGFVILLCAVIVSGCAEYRENTVDPAIYVNERSLAIFIGDKVQLTASPAGNSFVWNSENTSVATVSASGLVEATGAGITHIVVGQGNISTRIEVSVSVKIPLTDIQTSHESLLLGIGEEVKISALPVPENASVTMFEWSSSNTDVAKVSRAGFVEAVGSGQANIIIKGGDFQKLVSVTVPEAVAPDAKVISLHPNLYYSFTDDDLSKAAVGSSALEFSEAVSLTGGAPAGKNAVTVGKNNHVKVRCPVSGTLNTYTLMFDVKIPAINMWYSLFQADATNTNDGDLFISSSNKLGASRYSETLVEANKWYRIILLVDVADGASLYKVYLDGQHILTNESSSIPDRMSINDSFWIFTDEDGEENNLDCAGFAMWANKLLTDEEITALGKP